ncbi:MAG: hypothetical protein IJL83_04850, partial [Clostridia bacterium]|nr:hypothetical protein [Clostridia bacterium]
GHEPHWSAVGYTFKFDASKLTYKLWSWSPALVSQLLAGKGFTSVINDEHVAEGELIVTFLTTTSLGGYEGYYPYAMDNTYSDYIGTITFDVAEGAEDGLYEIAVTVDKLSTPTEGNVMVDVPSKGTNGGIKLGADECEHDWVETDRVAATCTEPGKITYTCSKCGETKDEPIDIDPDAHDWVEIGRTKATCAAEGVINYACSHNPDHTKDEPIAIDPDAHDWGDWTDSPDKEGWEQRVCKNDPTHIEEREKTVEPTAPVVSGITDGQEFDLNKGEKPAPTWEPADATATLNGEPYTAGTEIGETGDYTLVVTNGDKTTTVNFKVTDSSTTPEEPTAPAVTGITDGQEFDLGKGEKPAPTWEPADATATLNGKPYTAGTEITEAGDYELVVTDAAGNATTIKFKVTDSSATNPDQPNTSDLPVAGIAIVSLIAAAAVVVIARKKRFAR